ncbi:hypothetical protein L210DRAFT_3500259 [Boletus edulis BED1]|uniref:Uncharacterized protein n=1 Tax=Boletus edulis BED1 TaxID=1328754 RepID=A0AAD4C879_BOLED|nr:hypothetical protein L210DRAFT_3500259 [Boletus edulis BED1]
MQILTTLGSIDADHFDSYLSSLLVKLKSKLSKHLVHILKDNDMLDIAIALYKWPHMRLHKGHTGMSAHHFSGWGKQAPHTIAQKSIHSHLIWQLMKYFSKYMTRVLDFLSMPYNVASIEMVKREAEDQGKDTDQLLVHYTSMLRREVAKAARSPLCCKDQLAMRRCSSETWQKRSNGCNWDISSDLNDTWQHYLFVANFSCQMFSNCSPIPFLGIEKVLMEVITWVEPLMKYPFKQPNSATRTCTWNDALGALLAHANGDVEFEIKLVVTWIEKVSLFQLKDMDVNLISKHFIETLLKNLAALYASKDNHRRFLITEDGWLIRVAMGNILNDITNSTWKWWDGLDEQPQVEADEEPIDLKGLVPHLDDETTGNFVLQLTKSKLIQKTDYETVNKVTKLVLQNNIGYVVPGVFSPPIVNALKKLVKMGDFEASDAVAEKLKKGMMQEII